MKGPLRVQFFKWLCVQTLVVFLILGGLVTAFNLKEVAEHPDMADEESSELVVMLLGLVATIPLALLLAWVLSRQLVRPIKRMAATVDEIRHGAPAMRIAVSHPPDELGRLGLAVNDAFDRNQELVDRLDRFCYTASHQLRNPLAAIQAAGEVCMQKARNTEEYQETMGRMLEDATRLSRTVDQLLTLARISPRQLAEAYTPVPLAPLLRALAADAGPVCEAKSISLVVDAPAACQLSGSQDLLREALHNLLDNAIRLTPTGGTVRLSCEPVGAAEMAIGVSDSGPGLSPEQRAQVLRPFTRGRAGNSPEGHGLGLTIALDIARAHGGRLEIDTSELGGARFRLILPVAAAGTTAA